MQQPARTHLSRWLWVDYVLYEPDHQPLSDIRKDQVHWANQCLILASVMINDYQGHPVVYTLHVQLKPFVTPCLVSIVSTYLSLYVMYIISKFPLDLLPTWIYLPLVLDFHSSRSLSIFLRPVSPPRAPLPHTILKQ